VHVWAYDQGIRAPYVGTNKIISQIAYIVMMVWLYAEICSWLPEFWIYSCVWWTNVWIYVYVSCNTTGWITTKLRWFIFKPLQFIYPQLIKIPEKIIYSASVPTEIRMEVLSMPNWVFFNFVSIIVQRDATQSSLFIILQVHSTCFGCEPHPSSGLHKTVTIASSTDHIFVQPPPSNVAKIGHVAGR